MNMYGDDTFIQVFVLLILLPLKIKQKKIHEETRRECFKFGTINIK